MVELTPPSLVDFGMDPADEVELRWAYLEATEPLSEGDRQRGVRVARIVDAMLDCNGVFGHFYRSQKNAHRPLSTLTAMSAYSEVAIDEYARVTGLNLPPGGDGELRVKWYQDAAKGTLYRDWLARLDRGVPALTREEQKAISRIRAHSEKEIREAIKLFSKAKEFLAGRDEHERRQLERERQHLENERRARERKATVSQPLQQTYRTHRKYGELPPEPVIMKRRS
jgi:hypothetical protein